MKTKHLLTATFSMGLIVLISNTCLAFAVVHRPQYNAGYTAACNDSKHISIWESHGSIWDGFDQKYGALQDNPQWMQGYRDGALCNDKHTPEFNAGFSTGCNDKQAGLLNKDENDQYIVPANHDKNWTLGFYDSTFETSFCPGPKPK